MKQLSRWQLACLAAASILPVIGAVRHGVWLVGGLPLITAVAWGVAQTRYPTIAHDVGLAALLAGLAYAAWLDVSGGWLILAAALALAAWDLGHFQAQMAEQSTISNEIALWRTHWRFLALTLVVGLTVSGLALVINLELSFWPAFGLALFAIVSLSWLLRSNL